MFDTPEMVRGVAKTESMGWDFWVLMEQIVDLCWFPTLCTEIGKQFSFTNFIYMNIKWEIHEYGMGNKLTVYGLTSLEQRMVFSTVSSGVSKTELQIVLY